MVNVGLWPVIYWHTVLLLRLCYLWCDIISSGSLCIVYYMCYTAQYGELMPLAEHLMFPLVAVLQIAGALLFNPH